MKSIPYIEGTGKNARLIVDGKPFRALGGEIHNSSASSLKYMEEKVWPSVKLLGANSIVVPVYWECVEPQKGVYNFDLVDGIIEQARKADLLFTLETESSCSMRSPVPSPLHPGRLAERLLLSFEKKKASLKMANGFVGVSSMEMSRCSCV